MDTNETQQPDTNQKKRPRIFLWVFIFVQTLFILWIVVGASSQPEECYGLTAKDCQEAYDTGKAIGVGLIVGLWAAVDVILGITYAVYRFTRKN